jgi:hypothetical protein
MSDRKLNTHRQTTRVIAASGRIRNEHFMLTGDHILMEVDPASFELVSASAQGNLQIHMASPEPGAEFVIFARSAVYHPDRQRLTLTGCAGICQNGLDHPEGALHHEVVVPTDGTFLVPSMAEQADKILLVEHEIPAEAA